MYGEACTDTQNIPYYISLFTYSGYSLLLGTRLTRYTIAVDNLGGRFFFSKKLEDVRSFI